MSVNSYQQYKDQSILTMTKGEMLLVLFDELMKRLKRAEICLEHGEMVLFDETVIRCQDIVRYLDTSLDRSYPISAELSRMYDFFLFELARLKAGRRKEIIDEITPLVNDLRDAFSKAEKAI